MHPKDNTIAIQKKIVTGNGLVHFVLEWGAQHFQITSTDMYGITLTK